MGLSFRTATKGAGFLGCSIGCGVGIVLSFVRRWRPLHSSPARIAVALGMQELRVPCAARPFFSLSNSKFSITWCLCSFSLHFLNDVFFFSDILDMGFQTSNFPPLHLFFVYFSKRQNLKHHVDAVISLANPATYVGCDSQAGKVAEAKARDKNRDHPIFNSQTHRRMHPFDFCALSFERHGFWAKETVGFVKKLATTRAVALGLEPSEEVRRWYAAIACTIQRSNARVLRGEPVPGRPSPPPSRFAAMGRDLGFAA